MISPSLKIRIEIIDFLKDYKFQSFNSLFYKKGQEGKFQNKRNSIIFTLKNYIRNFKLCNYYLNSIVKKSHKLPEPVKLILLLGILQLSFQKNLQEYSIVNESVELTKYFKFDYLKNFVNAVLRNFIRQKSDLDKKLNPINFKNISIKYSFPEWIVKRWRKNFSDNNLIKLLEFFNSETFDLSVLYLENDVENFRRYLDEHSISYRNSDYFKNIFYVNNGKTLIELKNKNDIFKKKFIILDESSVLPILLFDFKNNENIKILEVGSFPGGKTVLLNNILKSKSNYELYLNDKNKKKYKMFLENQSIYSIKYTKLFIEDFLKLNFDFKFDKILIDAPCSAMGTIRKNPEIKYNRQIGDINKSAKLQLDILNKAINLLKSKSELVYSVCSFEKEETSELIKFILRKYKNIKYSNTNFLPQNLVDNLVENYGYFSLPFQSGLSGFFTSKLIKI